MKPAVSVIIPTYQNERFVSLAVDSVLAQSCRDFEIIIVDDGSTDRTREVLKKYNGIENIIIVFQTNQGPAAARNRGISLAQGKYLTFLDADDLFLPEKLSLQVGYLEAHPEIDLVYSDGLRFRTGKQKEKALPLSKTGDVIRISDEPQRYVYHLMARNIFPIHASLVRRECVLNVSGFDENLTACEDWDLWFRIAEKYKFAFLDGELVKYRITPGSNSADKVRNSREARKVFLKIGGSESFRNAPHEFLGNYYYHLGLTEMALGNSGEARAAFRESLAHPPVGAFARIACVLTSLLGRHVYLLYAAKRRIFGRRGIARL